MPLGAERGTMRIFATDNMSAFTGSPCMAIRTSRDSPGDESVTRKYTPKHSQLSLKAQAHSQCAFLCSLRGQTTSGQSGSMRIQHEDKPASLFVLGHVILSVHQFKVLAGYCSMGERLRASAQKLQLSSDGTGKLLQLLHAILTL